MERKLLAMGNRAGKYLRISDDREGKALGVARQDKDTDLLARRERLKVVDRYVDNDLSASTKARKERPEYQRLLADARAGKLDVIIAYTSGRLTRKPREHEDLIDLATECGIRYLFVRSPSFDLNSAQGRRVARTLAAQDAGEAEEIAERVKDEVKQRAEQSRYHGGPRGFGISADGLSIVKREAAHIRRWYDELLAGASLGSMAADMTRRKIPTTSGGTEWKPNVIRKILLNPRNAGLRVLNGAEYPASHPEIVPEATWRAACAILRNPGRTVNKEGTARKHIGTGLFLCERCPGRTVNSGYDQRGNLIYRCLGCWRSWRADPINDWLEDLVSGILAKEDRRRRLLPKRRTGIDVKALNTEASAIRQNMTAMAADFALAKGQTRVALGEGLAAGEKRLAEIESAIADAGRTSPLTALVLANDPVKAWRNTKDVNRRQAILRSMMTVELGAPIRGRATWDAEKFISVTPV